MTEDEIELEKLFKSTINYLLFYERVHDFAKQEADSNREKEIDPESYYMVEPRAERFVIEKPNEFAKKYFKGHEKSFFDVSKTNFYKRFLYADGNSYEITINEQPFSSVDENFKNLLKEGQIIDEDIYKEVLIPFFKFYRLMMKSAKELKSNGKYGIRKSGALYRITKPERFINEVAIKNLKYSDFSYNHNVETLLMEVYYASENYSCYFVNRQNENRNRSGNKDVLHVHKKEWFLKEYGKGHFFYMMDEYSSKSENTECQLRFKVLSLIDKFFFMKIISYLSSCFDADEPSRLMLKNTLDKIYIDLYELISLDKKLYAIVNKKYKHEWRLLEFKRHSFSHSHEIESIHYDKFDIELDLREDFDGSWLEDQELEFFLKLVINDFNIPDDDYYYSPYCLVVKHRLIDSIKISEEYIPFIRNFLKANEKNLPAYIGKIESLCNKKLRKIWVKS